MASATRSNAPAALASKARQTFGQQKPGTCQWAEKPILAALERVVAESASEGKLPESAEPAEAAKLLPALKVAGTLEGPGR
jgi:hypothetical protein